MTEQKLKELRSEFDRMLNLNLNDLSSPKIIEQALKLEHIIKVQK